MAKLTTEQIQEKIAKSQERQAPHKAAAQRQRDSDARLRAAGVDIKGARPGGLGEAMADPTTLAKSLEIDKRRREDRARAAKDLQIKSPHRPGDTIHHRVGFAEGATQLNKHINVGGNPRFDRKK